MGQPSSGAAGFRVGNEPQVVTFTVTDKQHEFVVVLDDNHKVVSTGSGASFADNVEDSDDNQKEIGTESDTSSASSESSGTVFTDIKNHWAENPIIRLTNWFSRSHFPT